MELDIKKPGGDSSPPSSKKSKLKFNKKSIIIVGVIFIVAILLLRKLLSGGSSQGETVVLEQAGSEYGSNSVDVASQLQSANSVMEQNMYSTLTSFMNDMTAQNNELKTGLETSLKEQQEAFNNSLKEKEEKNKTVDQTNTDALNSFKDQLEKMKETQNKEASQQSAILKDLQKKADALKNQKATTSTPAAATKKPAATTPKTTTKTTTAKTTTAKTTTAKTSTKTTTLKETPKTAMWNGQKLNVSTSVLDFMKWQGLGSSFNDQKKLAAKNGIKNYTGTAAQNVQLLNKLKKQKGYK